MSGFTASTEGRALPTAGLLAVVALTLAGPGHADVILRHATLGDALAYIAQQTGLEYVVCGPTPPRAELALAGTTPEEWLAAALRAWPCQWTRVGDLLLVDAQPAGPPPDEVIADYLRTTSPPGALSGPDTASPTDALREDLRQLWETRYRPYQPAANGIITYAPFVVGGDGDLDKRLQAHAYQAAMANARSGASPYRIPEEAWITLERPSEGYFVLQLNWRSGMTLQSVWLGPPLPTDRMRELETGPPLARRAEQYLIPHGLKEAEWCGIGLMSQRLSFEGATTAGDLLSHLSRGASRVLAAEVVAGLQVHARLQDRPRWMVLTVLSVASGIPWRPWSLSAEYVFGTSPPCLTDSLFASLSPPRRLAWVASRAWGNPPVVELLWAALRAADRERLAKGERLPVSDVMQGGTSAPILQLVLDWLFGQPSLDGVLQSLEQDRIWERLGGVCGVYIADDKCVRVECNWNSQTRMTWCLSEPERLEGASSPVQRGDGLPWRPGGQPPHYWRPFDRRLRDAGTDDRRTKTAEGAKLLGEAPGPG